MTIRPGCTTGALVLAGALALGQSSGAAAENEDEMARTAKVTIAQAIDAAEAKGQGKATEAEFDDGYGGRWEVKILSAAGDKLTTYFVDPNSGAVTGRQEQTFEKYFTRLTPENFQKARTQLKDAIAAAEQAAGGKATSAEVKRSSGAVAYEIDVARAQSSKAVDVDVDANGKAVIDD